jgi:death-on-curing protein
LTLADALSAHDRALTYGGLPGIPNIGLVESAIARPYNGYYRTIHQKAAALVESGARNHGFADGNKRTTLILLQTLLTKSGYDLLSASAGESIEQAVEEVILASVMGQMNFDQLCAWFEARIRKA